MPNDRWPVHRLAVAAYRAGQGRPLDRIAADPEVKSHAAVVQRRLQRVGIAPGPGRRDDVWVNLEPATASALAAMAQARGEPVEAFARRLLAVMVTEPTLVANVLDEG